MKDPPMTMTATASIVDRTETHPGGYAFYTHIIPEGSVCTVCGLPASVAWCTLDEDTEATWWADQAASIDFAVDARCAEHYLETED